MLYFKSIISNFIHAVLNILTLTNGKKKNITLRFSDPQLLSNFGSILKCYLSLKLYKWYKIKDKLLDGIHAFYKEVIANWSTMDIME